MPGYRALPEHFSGAVADLTREAGLLDKNGQHEEAIAVYERALAAATTENEVMPSFLCGRLALLYRRTGRHAEEVDLLERYQQSQTSEQERIRFDARLSKAKALLQKTSRSNECGALASIRRFGPSSYSRRTETRRRRGELEEPTQ
jgi:tetratricopeptide (TPR) repeat protein